MNCGKCFGEIKKEEVSVCPCNHVFHYNCLNKEFEMISRCQCCGDEGTYIYRYTYSNLVDDVTNKIKRVEEIKCSEEREKTFLKIIDEIIMSLYDLEFEITGLDVLRLMLLEKIDTEIRYHKRNKHITLAIKKLRNLDELKKRRDIISCMGLYVINEN